MSSVQRAPRKCSQCRQEKCNKNSVNCPVNIARGAVEVLREYKMCTEECGICYDKICNVTFNCNHQSCVGCFKGHFKATKPIKSSILKCPFCRGTIESVLSSDKNTRDILVGRK